MNVAPERCIVVEDSVAGISGRCRRGNDRARFHGGSHCRHGHGDSLRAVGAARDPSTTCGGCPRSDCARPVQRPARSNAIGPRSPECCDDGSRLCSAPLSRCAASGT
jgi:hypothetical protein